MPRLHKYFGNPGLTALLNIFFHAHRRQLQSLRDCVKLRHDNGQRGKCKPAGTKLEDETSQAGIVEMNETGWCRAPSSSTCRGAAPRGSPWGWDRLGRAIEAGRKYHEMRWSRCRARAATRWCVTTPRRLDADRRAWCASGERLARLGRR